MPLPRPLQRPAGRRPQPRACACLIALATLSVGPASASPVTLTPVPDSRASGGARALELVGDIPIDGAFEVRFAVAAGTRSAVLQVWPRAVQPDCDGEMPPYDAPQTHLIEMDVAPVGERLWATASVPHLQVDRSFCFRVQSVEGIPLPAEAGMGLVEASVTSDGIDDPGPWAEKFARRALDAACGAARRGEGAARCAPDTWAKALARRLVARVLASPLPLARASRATVARARETAGKVLGGLQARAGRLPPLPGAPFDATTVLRTDLPTLLAARDGLVASGESPAWRGWLTDYVAVAERLQFETERQEAAEQAVLDAEAALVTSLEAEIADFLTTEAYAERLSPAARGSARTRDANNYVTPVYGVGVGLPAHGGDVWLFTYAGAHIFIEPVERSVPFEALVGDTMAQRLSLFVGALTSDAGEVRGAQVGPGLGGAYPGLGLGWRLTQHLALDLVAFMYTATDDDPLNDRRALGATFAAGLTAELDIIKWLTPN